MYCGNLLRHCQVSEIDIKPEKIHYIITLGKKPSFPALCNEIQFITIALTIHPIYYIIHCLSAPVRPSIIFSLALGVTLALCTSA